MIKFIYQVENSEEAANPIGFSFWNTVPNTYCYYGGNCIWESEEEFIVDFNDTGASYPALKRFTDLIPEDWSTRKFKQV
jgi:hypothetical protein